MPVTGELDSNQVHGKVDKAYWDGDAGWYVCEGELDTAAESRLNNGDGISVGIKMRKRDLDTSGGSWHNIPYGKEAKRLQYHHLAIVEQDSHPRFEEAVMRLNCVLSETAAIAAKPASKPMFTRIKKLLTGDKPTEERVPLAPGAKINLGDGKTASIDDLVAIQRNNAVHLLDGSDDIEHEGCRYNCAELIAGYKSHQERMNSEQATEEQAQAAAAAKAAEGAGKKDEAASAEKKEEAPPVEKKEDTPPVEKKEDELARQNAVKEEAEGKRKQDEEISRENARREAGKSSFMALSNASFRDNASVVTKNSSSGSLADKVARGRKMFGSN